MKLLLVDLNSVLHPIWHVSGQEADQDHASRATVARIHREAAGYDGVAICCDSPKSVRKAMDPTYKANRPPHEAPLLHQIKLAQEQLRSDGFPLWTVEGYEADDVIASACEAMIKEASRPLVVDIFSADKDLLSLVDDVVTVVSPATGNRMGPVETAEKYAPPHQMRDYLIMVGDASDNIKGIPGVGKVKAKALLGVFGSIVGIYRRLSEGPPYPAPLTPAIVSAFQDGITTIDNARKLVTLCETLELPYQDILKPREAAEGGNVDDAADVGSDEVSGEVTEPQRSPSEPPKQGAAMVKATDAAPQATPDDDVKPKPAALATVEWNRELEPRSLKQVHWLAEQMFKSRLFSAYGTAQAVLSTILAGRELGVGAMASLRGFHVIEGKPSMSASLMAALVLRSGKQKYFTCVKSTSEVATFRTVRLGDEMPVEVSFTLEDAKRAGLVGKGNWTKYPADMLVSRAIARLARLVYPDVCFGLYTPDELGHEELELEEEAA